MACEHVCGGLSWLVIDTGGLRPLWATALPKLDKKGNQQEPSSEPPGFCFMFLKLEFLPYRPSGTNCDPEVYATSALSSFE